MPQVEKRFLGNGRGYQNYNQARVLSGDASFYALLHAAIRRADSSNLAKLESVFPADVNEVRYRYNAPGGMTPDELALSQARREVEEGDRYELVEDDGDVDQGDD